MWCEGLKAQEEAGDAETLTPLPGSPRLEGGAVPTTCQVRQSKSSSGAIRQLRGQES